MSVCPQASFSQRATCPPSAAVLQRSMALITFRCSRLTCPALVTRHAGPWRRKISATSSSGRDTLSRRYWADGSPFGPFLLWRRSTMCSNGLSIFEMRPVATRVYRAVVSSLSWPGIA